HTQIEVKRANICIYKKVCVCVCVCVWVCGVIIFVSCPAGLSRSVSLCVFSQTHSSQTHSLQTHSSQAHTHPHTGWQGGQRTVSHVSSQTHTHTHTHTH